MRNTVAKKIKRQAEGETVGQSKRATRKHYRKLKKEYTRK